jgi:glycosyltransferase involved in cell wall biosynthesis
VRIVFFTRYGTLGASSRYRFYQYQPSLESRGFECSFRPLFDNSILDSRYRRGTKSVWQNVSAILQRIVDFSQTRSADLIVLEGEFLPYFPAFFEKLLNLRKIPYAVDFDDAIFHYYDKSSRRLVRRLLGGKIKTVVKNAACVIAGNQYLAKYASNADAKRIEIVPTVIDLDKYPLKKCYPAENTGFRIGWIGSPGSSRYLELVRDPLSKLVSNDGCIVKLVGAGTDHGLADLLPEMQKWSDETEVAEIQTFDIGIMPLPEDDWAKGKCGFKLIQYMACSKPVIATPVGANCDIVQHGVNGFLAETADEWINAIRTLKENPDLVRRMGAAGRKLVEEKYCLQVTGPQLARIFKGCC